MDEPGDAALSDILKRWFDWQRGYKHWNGYPGASASTRDCVSSHDYDAEDGTVDAALENQTMEIVEFEVGEIPEPGRTGLHVNARALGVGLSVFRSPRLPEDQVQTVHIIMQAREELTTRLHRRGVL